MKRFLDRVDWILTVTHSVKVYRMVSELLALTGDTGAKPRKMQLHQTQALHLRNVEAHIKASEVEEVRTNDFNDVLQIPLLTFSYSFHSSTPETEYQ